MTKVNCEIEMVSYFDNQDLGLYIVILNFGFQV